MKYDWLLFDLDDTILDFNEALNFAFYETLKKYEISSKEDLMPTYKKINRACWDALEEGTLSQNDLRHERIKRFLEAIGSDHDPAAYSTDFHLSLSANIYYVGNAESLLPQWSKSFNLAMVTNGFKDIQRPRIEKAELEKHFKHITISDEIGVSKPRRGFFDYTFKQINHPPKERVLIIGDSLGSDIKGGNDFGIDTCWFNHHGKKKPSDNSPTFAINKLEELDEIIR